MIGGKQHTKKFHRKMRKMRNLSYYSRKGWCESEVTQNPREIRTKEIRNIALDILQKETKKIISLIFLTKNLFIKSVRLSKEVR